MKKIIYLSFVLTFLLIIFQASTTRVMRKEGAEPGHTGSPGDGFKNCTACHGGDAQTVEGWISSDIPSTGYMPGETYTITTSNNESEGTRFGFQVSPQNDTGKLLGELIVSDSIQTQLVGNKKYITYTENGVEGQGSKTWTFKWKAPAQGTGKVVFYGAYNSNFQGHKGSDHTFLSTLVVNEHGTVKVNEIPKVLSNFSVFPNPTNDILNIQFLLNENTYLLIEIVDSYGKKISTIMNEKQYGLVNKQFNTSQLATGLYFVNVTVDGKTYSEKISVKN